MAGSIDLVPEDVRARYEIHEWRNAIAILHMVHPGEWNDIMEVLRGFTLPKSAIVAAGGGKTKLAAALDSGFYGRDWVEKHFETSITVDGTTTPSPTHKVDCFKNRVALEVEWNNKDPFYDRDLNNFRLLFDLRAVDVGVIITRSDGLTTLFKELGVHTKSGASTTHMSKLLPRLEGGGGGGCPVVVFGIERECYVDDMPGTPVPDTEIPEDEPEEPDA